jgi:hypothetical protein
MNKICDFCTHQRDGSDGKVECGAAKYHSPNDGYGPFKYGATCQFDGDLKPLFEPRTGAEIDIQNMSSVINRQRNELMVARDTISKLQARLIKVEG